MTMKVAAQQPIRSLDWTRVSDDPNNPDAKARVRQAIRDMRRVHADTDIVSYVERAAAGKRMLDVGMVNHTRTNWHSEWRHRRFVKVASYILGIDILAEMIDQLAKQGYNVRTVDATSDIDLGERFDLIFAGDVIEHVDNAVGLLKFSGRHLAPGGRILMSTPNAFSRKFVRQFRREGVIVVNLDHVAWVTPTMALEIAHRAGLQLTQVHLNKRLSKWKLWLKENLVWKYEPVEYTFPDYLYEFRAPTNAELRRNR